MTIFMIIVFGVSVARTLVFMGVDQSKVTVVNVTVAITHVIAYVQLLRLFID